MKSFQLFALLLVAPLLGACSSTQVADNANPAAAGATQVASAELGSPNAITCKKVIKTGTRIGTRLCKPNREWEQDARTSKEAVENIQRGNVHSATMIGN
ncbi:hypothetical protein Q6D67_00770 [Haliea sp. E1-2-M8]|uniref:hypothetical protein n=1 Tax=Haliea sp. E1-2-M8 TaxID=3064706 RepID=UPI0027219272|nr:hypothetical protein [Haliea sp. E1-2-M8]MDO8860217.1 hypothetical protein [Haliea sp. E1-2-M8]